MAAYNGIDYEGDDDSHVKSVSSEYDSSLEVSKRKRRVSQGKGSKGKSSKKTSAAQSAARYY